MKRAADGEGGINSYRISALRMRLVSSGVLICEYLD